MKLIELERGDRFILCRTQQVLRVAHEQSAGVSVRVLDEAGLFHDLSGRVLVIPKDEETVSAVPLTKREYFAAKALQGLLSATDASGEWSGVGAAAGQAVIEADALLAALEANSAQL